MRIPRIYTPQALQSGEEITLQGQAGHHLSRVLRHQPGDAIILFNGNGREFAATITAIDKRRVIVALGGDNIADSESPLQIHLGIAISKGDRFDWVLQKSTELGVSAITPLLTERTEFRLKGDRLEKKCSHWQQVIISACEQCRRNRLPSLASPTPLFEWLPAVGSDTKLVLHHRSDQTLKQHPSTNSVALLIGPEGGLSEAEISAAESAGFTPLTLGPRVLRTETAPVAAIAALQYAWGDFC